MRRVCFDPPFAGASLALVLPLVLGALVLWAPPLWAVPSMPREREAVQILSVVPARAHYVVGTLRVDARDVKTAGTPSRAQLMDALRREAGRSGADALLDAKIEVLPLIAPDPARSSPAPVRMVAEAKLLRFSPGQGVFSRRGLVLFFRGEKSPADAIDLKPLEVKGGPDASRLELMRGLLQQAGVLGAHGLRQVEIVEVPGPAGVYPRRHARGIAVQLRARPPLSNAPSLSLDGWYDGEAAKPLGDRPPPPAILDEARQGEEAGPFAPIDPAGP